ncbi:MAG: hypothetical protein V2A58_03030 [Planctomycetota bacterium]
MDSKVRTILLKALALPDDSDDPSVHEALRAAGIEGGRLFTQEEVNAILATNKKALRAENETLRRDLDETATLLSSLASVEDPDPATAGLREDTPPEGGPRSLIVRLDARLADLRRELAEAREARDSECARAFDLERDRALVSAAARAGMIDPEGEALPLFRDRVSRADDGPWEIRDDEGSARPLDEGLVGLLEKRKHLLRPAVRPGAGTGCPREVDPVAAAVERLRVPDPPHDGRDERSLLEVAGAVLEIGRARRGPARAGL